MRSVVALSVAAFASISAAQSVSESSFPYSINPDSVALSTRQYWCQQNQAQCPLICLQQPGVTSETTTSNTCSADNLSYTCVCSNGVSPNITQYSQTLPFFICQEWGNQCVNNCNGDSTCGSNCRSQHPCGAQDPFKGNASLSSSMVSATASMSATSKPPTSGFAGQTTAPNNKHNAAPASMMPGAALSMGVVFGSIFLGFAVLL